MGYEVVMDKSIMIVTVLGLMAGYCWEMGEGRFVVETNSITVVQPYDLHAKHNASISDFGVPKYGGSLVGSVVYPSAQHGGPLGCSSFQGFKPFKSKTSRPNILLLDRG
ncbi:unnamed protein product, partial [Cuscuta epithymum]